MKTIHLILIICGLIVAVCVIKPKKDESRCPHPFLLT